MFPCHCNPKLGCAEMKTSRRAGGRVPIRNHRGPVPVLGNPVQHHRHLGPDHGAQGLKLARADSGQQSHRHHRRHGLLVRGRVGGRGVEAGGAGGGDRSRRDARRRANCRRARGVSAGTGGRGIPSAARRPSARGNRRHGICRRGYGGQQPVQQHPRHADGHGLVRAETGQREALDEVVEIGDGWHGPVSLADGLARHGGQWHAVRSGIAFPSRDFVGAGQRARMQKRAVRDGCLWFFLDAPSRDPDPPCGVRMNGKEPNREPGRAR